MVLSELDKVSLSRALLGKLRWRLLDKSGPILPPDGKYYWETSPHDRSAVGSIAHMPDYEELSRGIQTAPNSLGLVFLLSPPTDGPMVLEVEGHFDLEHAYIPDYADQCGTLVQESGRIRVRQDLADAYKRYTVAFSPCRFEIPTSLPVAVIRHSHTNTLQQAVDAHLSTVAADRRVYHKLVCEPQFNRPKWWLDWNDRIIDQNTLNIAVHEALFEPHSGPLPYSMDLQCRARRAPASMRTCSSRDEYLIEVFFVNKTTRETSRQYRLYDHRVMDVNLRARIIAGQHCKMRFHIAPDEYRYEPVQEIDGYGVTCALVRCADGSLISDSLPTYEQPLSQAPTPDEVGMREAPEFERLARNPLPVLDELMLAIERYSREWAGALEQMLTDAPASVEHARLDFSTFEEERQRVCAGINLLRENDLLMRAFKLMNEVMLEAVIAQRKSFRAWRLFQLGFIMTQLSDIAARFDSASAEPVPTDVLWFSTGGGKTEAYLGLIALAMFYQRLKGRSYGVTAWMRFPLRMLTVQQFQRLAYVIGAANRIRVREQIPGFPFSIGYFTGDGTPNRISSREPYAAENYLPQMTRRADWQDKLRFIDTCPHCNSPVEVRLTPEIFRIKHVCTNAGCWSNQPGDSDSVLNDVGELGIYVSDEECYRYLPTVLLGTLDKLVVLGHNGNFRKFFGTTHYCPKHGFIVGSRCAHSVVSEINGEWTDPVECGNNSRNSAQRTVRLKPLVDPGFPLLINDELHLLKEDLGNFDSHYESALEAIQRSFTGGRPPKILAATATIRDFENHIHHLYLRPARRFPAAGMRLDSSFYSRLKRNPVTGEPLIRRIYVGAQPTTAQPNVVAEWVCDANERYHQLIGELLEGLRKDPQGACRELELDISKAQVTIDYISSMLTPSLLYVRRLTDADHLEARFRADNDRRRNYGEMERAYARLDSRSALADIQKIIARIERNDAQDPLRQIVATSVVSHGVDVERINIQCFCGWPPSTAEYIQASSRSGRVHTGIVLTALSSRKLIEAGIFSHFREYHRFMERLVEAVPINRFAPDVFTRTLPGIFSALVLNVARMHSWGRCIRYSAKSLSEALNHPGAADDLEAWVLQAYGFEQALKLGVFDTRQVQEAKEQAAAEIKRLVALFRRVQARYATEFVNDAIAGMYGHGPLESLRDIERQVSLKPATLVDQDVFDAIGAFQ